MSITFKKTSFKGSEQSALLLFIYGKKKSELLNKLKYPKLSKKESLVLGSQDKIQGAGAVIFNLDGGKKSYSVEDFREIGGSFFKKAKSIKTKKLVFIANDFSMFGEAGPSLLAGAIEGALLSDYKMTECKSKAAKEEKTKIEVYSTDAKTSKKIKEALKSSEKMVEAVHFARTLGDLPGNKMTPTILAKKAQSLKGEGLKVTVWNKARIQKEKMGGLLGVAAGSNEEPRFIIMEYKSPKAKSKKPTLLVGKGLTFDAGGISIKPSAGMDEMRYDMCGGAAVIGAMKYISSMNLPVHVIGLVPSTENLLGASACKPGDVLTAKNGKTIEVLNTDAEGRLILADALSYASTLNPKQVLNTATLTGAMVVALGNSHTGFFTRFDELAEKLSVAGKSSGENLWRMPLCDDHSADMKGTFADLSNLASFRGAGSATAAAFLENFCDEGIPFVHLDIAGTAWNAGKRKSYHPAKGATGVLVRTFYDFVKANA